MKKLFFYLLPIVMALAISEQYRLFSVAWAFLFVIYPFWASIIYRLFGEKNQEMSEEVEKGWVPIINQKHDIPILNLT